MWSCNVEESQKNPKHLDFTRESEKFLKKLADVDFREQCKNFT